VHGAVTPTNARPLRWLQLPPSAVRSLSARRPLTLLAPAIVRLADDGTAAATFNGLCIARGNFIVSETRDAALFIFRLRKMSMRLFIAS